MHASPSGREGATASIAFSSRLTPLHLEPTAVCRFGWTFCSIPLSEFTTACAALLDMQARRTKVNRHRELTPGPGNSSYATETYHTGRGYLVTPVLRPATDGPQRSHRSLSAWKVVLPTSTLRLPRTGRSPVGAAFPGFTCIPHRGKSPPPRP